MRDINISPCKWHIRIWDVENNEWLCENDKDALPYYGFDIRGGEVTAIQGMSGVYNAFAHGKEFIWEQSTGLSDRNCKEIYEGDVLGVYEEYCDENGDNVQEELVPWGVVVYEDSEAMFGVWADSPFYGEDKHFFQLGNHVEVIGNIHENKELLGGKE